MSTFDQLKVALESVATAAIESSGGIWVDAEPEDADGEDTDHRREDTSRDVPSIIPKAMNKAGSEADGLREAPADLDIGVETDFYQDVSPLTGSTAGSRSDLGLDDVYALSFEQVTNDLYGSPAEPVGTEIGQIAAQFSVAEAEPAVNAVGKKSSDPQRAPGSEEPTKTEDDTSSLTPANEAQQAVSSDDTPPDLGNSTDESALHVHFRFHQAKPLMMAASAAIPSVEDNSHSSLPETDLKEAPLIEQTHEPTESVSPLREKDAQSSTTTAPTDDCNEPQRDGSTRSVSVDVEGRNG